MAHENVRHYGGSHVVPWQAEQTELFQQIECGHCGTTVGAAVIAEAPPWYWLRCPICSGGTVVAERMSHGPRARYTRHEQYPPPPIGPGVDHLPDDVGDAFVEARECFSVAAYSATETVCRKILAHVAVDKGAAENLKFIEYVEYLEETSYITPPMKPWADLIRSHGNAAVHDLTPVEKDRAAATLQFTTQLLRIVYEMPGIAGGFLRE